MILYPPGILGGYGFVLYAVVLVVLLAVAAALWWREGPGRRPTRRTLRRAAGRPQPARPASPGKGSAVL